MQPESLPKSLKLLNLVNAEARASLVFPMQPVQGRAMTVHSHGLNERSLNFRLIV